MKTVSQKAMPRDLNIENRKLILDYLKDSGTIPRDLGTRIPMSSVET